MQTSLKKAIGAALLASTALGALSAHAAAISPSTGDGSLLFFLTDTKTNQTYTDVLTQTVNSYFSASQSTSPAPVAGTLNKITGDQAFTVSLASDASLSTFLAAAGTDTLNWGIIAGAGAVGTSATNKVTGAIRVVTTSSSLPAVLTGVAESAISGGGVQAGLTTDITTLNDLNHLNGANSGGLGVFGTNDSQNGTNLSLYGAQVDQAGLLPGGSAVTLYGLTANGKTNGTAFAYDLGTVSYNGSTKTISFAGNGSASVPLPAAVWLFGSGILGLAGIGRRKKVAVAA